MRNPARLVPILALAVPLVALAADELQAVDAGGLRFQAPAAWKKSTPTNNMRKAQMTIPAAAGAEPGQLVVFAFPEGAGTVEQNIERYQRQFQDKDGKPPKGEISKVKGKNVEVTRLELSGTYTDTINRAGPKPDSRMLVAIAEAKGASYFVRLVGPDKTISAAEPAFDALIKTIEVGAN